jgi:hypothetical protein
MTNRLLPAALLLAALAGLSAGAGTVPAPAADETKADARAGHADDVRYIAMAYELAEYGRAKKAPEALIAAARVLRGIRTTPGEEKVKVDGAKDEKDQTAEPGEAVSLVAESDKLLEEAKKMAPKDKAIKELANQMANESRRPAVGGPRSYSYGIRQNVTHYWNISFFGGMPASVTVQGNGNNYFTVESSNERGTIVAQSSGRHPHITWVPAATRTFTIRVRNNGPGPAHYTMYTN